MVNSLPLVSYTLTGLYYPLLSMGRNGSNFGQGTFDLQSMYETPKMKIDSFFFHVDFMNGCIHYVKCNGGGEPVSDKKRKMAEANKSVCHICGLDCRDKSSLERHLDWAHKTRKARKILALGFWPFSTGNITEPGFFKLLCRDVGGEHEPHRSAAAVADGWRPRRTSPTALRGGPI